MPSATSRLLMPKACENCRSKKTRCDRLHPCQTCTRSGSQCIFTPKRSLPRGRAGGRKSDITHLRERVVKLESIIHQLQAKAPSITEIGLEEDKYTSGEPRDTALSRTEHPSGEKVSTVDGVSTFWNVLTAEISQLQGALASSLQDVDDGTEIDEDLPDPIPSASSPIFAVNPLPIIGIPAYRMSRSEQDSRHPPKSIRDDLVSLYLQNIDPIFKIVHGPTLRAQLDTLNSMPPPATNAILFAVYAAAIMSTTDTQCEQLLGRNRIETIHQFYQAAQTSLQDADLLNSRDLTTLQAFILLLLVLRSIDSGQRQWALIALAVRLARGMDLHRVGNGRSLSSLDREVRCRIWHQLRVLEFRAALDRGDKSEIDEDGCSTPPISNLHDEDLSNNISDFPPERQEITASTFSVLSQQCVTLCKRLNQSNIDNVSSQQMQDEWTEKRRLIHDFELKLSTFFRLCDDNDTLHWYTKAVFGGLTPMFRLMYYRPLWQRSRLRPQPADRSQLLDLALESLRNEDVSVSASHAQPYAWHIWVQWYTLAVALAQLCAESPSDRTDSAWAVVERSYAHQSRHVADSVNGKLWKPIKELMKKARSLHKATTSSELQPLQTLNTNDVAQSTQRPIAARSFSRMESDISLSAHKGQKNAEYPTFSDDTWVLQQSIMDPSIYDEAWSCWEDFVAELSAF